MFDWHVWCAPVAWPASRMQSPPVWTATPPRTSTTPTWRTRASASAARAAASASSAVAPACSRSRIRGPWAGSTTDCVATAPTPGRAQVQSEPTENQCDWTAAPASPVAGSNATMEYVPCGRTGGLVSADMGGRGYCGDDPRRSCPGTYPRHPARLRPRVRRRLARGAALRGHRLSQCDDPTVPWHRIVRADGSLARGERQRALLEAEGIPFRGERVDMRIARLPE